MITFRILEKNKFEDDGSMILITHKQEAGSGSNEKTLGEFLKSWVIDLIVGKNRQKKINNNVLRIKDKEFKPIWLEKEIVKYQKKSIKSTKIKTNIIFNKINYIHPIFKQHTYTLKDFVEANKNTKQKQSSIELESIYLAKIGQLIVKNNLVINPISETIEIMTNVKVKCLRYHSYNS